MHILYKAKRKVIEKLSLWRKRMNIDSIHSAFITPSNDNSEALLKLSGENKVLTFIAQDGSVHKVHYVENDRGNLALVQNQGFLALYSYNADLGNEKRIVFDTQDILEIKPFLLGSSPEEISKLVCKVIKNAQTISLDQLESKVHEEVEDIKKESLREASLREERMAKYGTRTFHVITSILATPTEMLQGVYRLAKVCARVCLALFKFLQLKYLEYSALNNPAKIKPLEIETSKKELQSLVSSCVKDVRVALLQMIPFVGAQLANQYRISGSLQGFLDAPAIGGILESLGCTAPKFVYADFLRKTPSINRFDYHEEREKGRDVLSLDPETIFQLIQKNFLDYVHYGFKEKPDRTTFFQEYKPLQKKAPKDDSDLAYLRLKNPSIDETKAFIRMQLREREEKRSKIATASKAYIESKIKEFSLERQKVQNTPSQNEGDRMKRAMTLDSLSEIIQEYELKLQHASEDAFYSRGFQNYAVFARIPVVASDGKTRYHDGTMYFAQNADITNKTVVLYHGNAEHRDNMKYIGDLYLSKGYNVLLASYAGDHVVQGDGKEFKDVSTKCSELAMREDAQADFEFLKNLGVREISAHGISLGGAQAMNFVEAVGKQDDVKMGVVVLDRTFTNMPEVVERVTKNKTKSPFLGRLARDLTKRFIATETENPEDHGCDGLDNVKKLQEVSSKPSFQNTKFCFVGGKEDDLMGDKKAPTRNFAKDLYEIVRGSAEGRAFLKIQEGSHNSSFDSRGLEPLFL
jgi:dienelactone hydrolase